jgi:hypothetical protein
MSYESDASDRSLAPSLQLSADMLRGRYPNQFFDLAQQYMPPTIKELFRWCTFYYYNSPLINAAITKISRYPITDLVFEDEKESIRATWEKILTKELRLKDRLMEVNLDYHAYGNAFVSIHLPFTRFLKCRSCGHSAPIQQWKWQFNHGNAYDFSGTCTKCGTSGITDVRDVPYKDRKAIRILRWNPENIYIKYNEYTGRRIYMYTVPYKLKTMIQRGDKDILEDIPLVVIEALKQRRMIRFNDDNFRHLRRPTLAEQDQGWGKPLILSVLKDMYYLYTLRRAQEAIAMEHIVPFDIIYPMPNAQQDPYIHTDLANWRVQIETIIKKHRRDPNYKGVIPIPVGFGRIGGDGKAMMLTPELNYLNQTIVGGMGLPQEFLFGGLNYTGSSISLRTLENDFIQNRSQLQDLVLWIKDKIRIWLNYPDIENIDFADFRMADDIQRNQQIIGLNAQLKVSDQTMLTELGYNWEQEQKKMIEEAHFQNFVNDIRAKASAKTQGEAGVISFNYQQKINELAQKAQAEAQRKAEALGLQAPGGQQVMPSDPQQGAIDQAPPPQMNYGSGWENMVAPPVQPPSQQTNAQIDQEVEMDLSGRAERFANKLVQFPPFEAKAALIKLKAKMPDFGTMVEKVYNQSLMQAVEPEGNMEKMPESAMATGMS